MYVGFAVVGVASDNRATPLWRALCSWLPVNQQGEMRPRPDLAITTLARWHLMFLARNVHFAIGLRGQMCFALLLLAVPIEILGN